VNMHVQTATRCRICDPERLDDNGGSHRRWYCQTIALAESTSMTRAPAEMIVLPLLRRVLMYGIDTRR